MRPLWLLLMLVVSGVATVSAQANGGEGTQCTYATCALRVDGSWVVSGSEGRRIGELGFLSIPTLRPWIEVSDSASYYYRVVEDHYVSGQVAGMAGLLLWTAGYVGARGWAGTDKEWIALGVGLGGLGLTIHGARKMNRSRDAIQSTIWWYNGTLADGSTSTLESAYGPPTIPPVAVPQYHGDTGAVVGSLIGIAAGLAISSRHTQDQLAQGLGETVAIGAVGGFIGWDLGRNVQR